MPAPVSAGLLAYRLSSPVLEVLLAHPGGPLFEYRDEGVWTIPKGKPESGEELLEAAIREFEEETGSRMSGPFLDLGFIVQKAGKTVHGWGCEADIDASKVTSNEVRMEWPRKSGFFLTFPEIDRCKWFSIAEARQKINPAQADFFERLQVKLSGV